MKTKVVFSWSGGKDSAFAFHELEKNSDIEVVALLTTLTEDYGRISMHGVRSCLLDKQAASMGLALEKVYIPKNCSNADYGSRMNQVLTKYLKIGVSGVVFGDIFLEDLKKYRENKLSTIGMKAYFPLWKKDTRTLADAFIDRGFCAIVTCSDSRVLGKDFIGRYFDKRLLSELPSGVDPCGENGEFHSFTYSGPIFRDHICCKKGEIVFRDNRFYYCDLLPSEDSSKINV